MGDLHGLNVYKHQPIKVAAMEGHWETGTGVPLLLFAFPDEAAETNRYAFGIPKGVSLLLEHTFEGEVRGLKEVGPEDRPPVAPVFFSFRIMVGIGLLMLFIAWLGVMYIRRDAVLRKKWYLRCVVAMTPAGFIATLAGWYVAEIGRQPWVVYGLMRTADAVSPVSAAQVWSSLTAFVIVYGTLFAAYLFYLLHIIRQGPGTEVTSVDHSAIEKPLSPETHGRPAFVPTEDK
jgi:cytochrome d ubiquinol oxidase subunit I